MQFCEVQVGWGGLCLRWKMKMIFEKWKSGGRTLSIIPQPTVGWLFEPANQIAWIKLGFGTFYGWLFEWETVSCLILQWSKIIAINICCSSNKSIATPRCQLNEKMYCWRVMCHCKKCRFVRFKFGGVVCTCDGIWKTEIWGRTLSIIPQPTDG